jgi:hypothetical protein
VDAAALMLLLLLAWNQIQPVFQQQLRLQLQAGGAWPVLLAWLLLLTDRRPSSAPRC